MDTAEGKDNAPGILETVSDSGASERPVKTKKRHRTTAEQGEEDTGRTAEENRLNHSRKTEKKKKRRRKERERTVSTENETHPSIALDCIGQAERRDAREAGTRSSELPKEKHAWKSSEDGGVTADTEAEAADCRAQEGLDVTLGEDDILPEGLTDASERAMAEEVEGLDGESRLEYETAVQLLKEFIPKIRNMPNSKVMDMVKFDLPRFLSFKEQGIAVRYGRFTAEENQQIRTNMAEYMELTGIDSADKILHTERYPEQAVAIRELKKQHRLCRYIATGIARPWCLVLSRALKIFDPFNYKGRYSKEEIAELRRYHATCGNSWMQIANRMSRSNLSVALKFSQLRNPTNHGHWSKAEKRRLVHAVEDVILNARSREELETMASAMEQSIPGQIPTLVREKLYKGITWVEVEAKVKTRNWMQCKLKWNDYLTKRMSGGVRVYQGLSALQAKIKLIQRLYNSQVEDSNDIDWEEMAGCIGDVPPAYAQMKFYKLKAVCVPSWHTKTFPEIVDYLYEVKLPVFEARLEKMKEEKKLEEMPAQEKQKVFRITDIFQDSDSEGSEPEDN